jgi:multiple sugar transport system permease protein/raffinose/stachyose/melibiose transport system permease protein
VTAVFLIPLLLFFVLFLLYPMLKTFYLSFFRLESSGMNAILRPVGLANFMGILKDAVFLQAVRSTLVWAILGVATEIPLGLLLALVLSSRIHGSRLFRVVWFLPVMLSEVIVAIMWSLVYEPRIGLLNHFLEALGLHAWTQIWLGNPRLALYALIAVSTWMWTGFNMVLYLAGISSIPKDLLDAALVDGASKWQQVRHVIWPLLRNLTATLVLLSFTGKLKVFGLPWVATPRGGPLGTTETVSTYMVRRAFFYQTFDEGYPAAMATVWFLVIMVFAVVMIRTLRRREKLEF